MSFIRHGPAIFSKGWRSARSCKVTAGHFSVANVEIVPASQVKEGSSILLVNPGEAAAAVEAFKALQGYLKATGSIQGGSVRMASGGDFGGDFGAEGLLNNWKKASIYDQARAALLVSGTLELAFHLIGSIKDASGDPLETLSEIMQKFRPIDPSDHKSKQQIDEIWKILTEMRSGVNIGKEPKKPPPGTAVKLKNDDGLEGGGKKDGPEDAEEEESGEDVVDSSSGIDEF